MLWLFELLNDSPPLFVILLGKYIFAEIGIVIDSLFSAPKPSGTFIFKLEVPIPEGGIEILFCI